MPDITKRLEKADKLLHKGKKEAALEEYLGALSEDPGNERGREAAADLCLALNRDRDAARLLGEIFDRAAATADLGKAIATYKKLVRVVTPAVDQTFRYAQFIEKSNKSEAVEAYEAAVQGFIASGRKPAALTALKRVVALGASQENLRRAGELAAELGDHQDAATAFLRVGKLAQRAGGDPVPWYKRAHALDPTSAAAVLAYGRALLAQGDAAGSARLLAALARAPTSSVELREVYARALLAAGRAEEAVPVTWDLLARDPAQIEQVLAIIGAMLEAGQVSKALQLTHKLVEHEIRADRLRDCVPLIKSVADNHQPDAEFLEYLADLLDTANREHEYCETLLKLFQLYYAGGNFLKAGDCLDRAVAVDAYEPGHQARLEMLRGKIDAHRFSTIADRLTPVLKAGAPEEEAPQEVAPQPAADQEGTVLEDLVLQAEIFLQYSMRAKAIERLERIRKLFPHEEDKNAKLRDLYLSAGFPLQYDAAPLPPSEGRAAGRVPQAAADQAAVDNISRVTEITRNLYRQGSVKSVLFAAVNDIGRHWNASRCVAGLCTPGKPPSAALEYCAPGVKQSEVMAIVKLIGTLQSIAVQRGAIAVTNAVAAPELARVHSELLALGAESVLAVPLTDGEEHVGILILEQCGAPRAWRQTDVMVLKTIAEHMVLAVNNTKLRSLVKNLAVTEEKSGLLKRSSYLDVLLSEVKRSLPQDSPLTLMLISFGKASALVREVGEPAVNATMQEIGQIICSQIRQNDLAVRYDLTGIVIILADTNEKNAFFVVDKLRKVLSGIRPAGRSQPLPFTVGIAEAAMQPQFDPVDIVTEVVNRAETALQAAKAAGGNKAQALAPALETAARA